MVHTFFHPAEASKDFVPAAVPFTFHRDSDNTVCEQFKILPDSVALENDEIFVVDLSIPSLITLQGIERSMLNLLTMASSCIVNDMVVSSANITIKDTDGKNIIRCTTSI